MNMRTIFKKIFLVTVLMASVSFGLPNAANASGFSQFIGLGDSTLDSGYFKYHSTGNVALDTQLAASIASGVNFAL